MMKRLILCEGKNDGEFFQQIFQAFYVFGIHTTRIFDQNMHQTKNELRYAETNELNRFQELWNPYQILVKSESGKDKVMYLFSSIMHYCISNKAIDKTIIMLDLDNSPTQTALNKIQMRVLDKISDKQFILEPREVMKNGIISFFDVSVIVKKDKTKIGSFCLVLWTNSLEYEMNKFASDHKDNSVRDLISKLIAVQEVQDIFRDVLVQ